MPKVGENIAIALIAALSAIAGTVVGAVVTYNGNQQLQNRQVHQEEARQITSARAVARLLMTEYHTEADRLEELLAEREYIPSIYRRRIFVSRIGLEDRKLLAGQLSESDWVDISYAANAIEEVEADMEIHRGKGTIDSEELGTLRAARTDCNTAYTALTPLAEGKSAT